MTSVFRMGLWALLTLLVAWATFVDEVQSAAGKHTVPAKLSTEKQQAIITFGPVDLPTGSHDNLPERIQQSRLPAPQDLVITGYTAKAFLKDGTPLPGHYLHHILLGKMEEKSLSCEGEQNFFAGTGFELTEARFPAGFGIHLEKGKDFFAVLDFYHEAPLTRDVFVNLIMDLAPAGSQLEPLFAYHIGVNVGCYTKFHNRPADETSEGILLTPGVMVRSAPVRFLTEGCVKYAYPHGHDQLLLMTLENKSTRQTLLRTVPRVAADGTLIEFPSSQIYSDAIGFSVNQKDEYEMTMVYHKPFNDDQPTFGMANYNLYMTRKACPGGHVAQDLPSQR